MDLEVQKLLEKADGNFAIFDSVAKAHSVLSRYDSICRKMEAGAGRSKAEGGAEGQWQKSRRNPE